MFNAQHSWHSLTELWWESDTSNTSKEPSDQGLEEHAQETCNNYCAWKGFLREIKMETAQGDLIHVWKFLTGGKRGSSQQYPMAGQELKHIEFRLNYLIHEDSQAVAQAAQDGCGDSMRTVRPCRAWSQHPLQHWFHDLQRSLLAPGAETESWHCFHKTHPHPLPSPEHLTVFRTLT